MPLKYSVYFTNAGENKALKVIFLDLRYTRLRYVTKHHLLIAFPETGSPHISNV